MLKKDFIEQLNNENHYTIPKYVLAYAKDLGLDMSSLILLIYFLNKPNKTIFDYRKIIEDLNFSEKELLDAISILKDRNILLILMEKNDSGVLEEKIDIVLILPGLYNTGFNKLMFDKKYDDIDSYFNSQIELIRKSENLVLKLFEKKKLDSIVNKIVTAINSENPKFIYSAPFTQNLFAKIISIFY